MNMQKTHYLLELEKPLNYVKKGQQSPDVKRVQEWINLWRFYDSGWNFQIRIDSDFGDATEYAVRQFQIFKGLREDGVVGAHTWTELVKPMRLAFNPISFYSNDDIRERVVAYAQQQLWSKPTELGNNEGPWVRAYLDGNEGKEWRWCAGFVETVLDRAYSSLGDSFKKHFPDPSYYSCDMILNYAGENNRLVKNAQLMDKTYVPLPGDMFLIMNPANLDDATHIGFVISCADTVLTTIEGNISDNIGPKNSGEVCQKTRNMINYVIYVIKLI
jgi:hypothetical protein